jgi:SAM-dependent methyltransferase
VTDRKDLDRLYRHRFNTDDAARKLAVWAEIVAYLERWIGTDSIVLDVACDRGYFIRKRTGIRAVGDRYPRRRPGAGRRIRFVQVDGLELVPTLPERYFDVVFASNYLRHLPDADAVVRQLAQARRVPQPGGRVIVLQPNIRFVGGAYWDFLDHRLPLTERSLVEAALLTGLEVEKLVPRFLPYTTKGQLPSHPLLVRAYLRVPLAWRVLGRQTLLIARTEGAGT